ncbi:MAG: DUF664 domain-containing protein [Gemmatimonadaceae bacterium]
MTLVTMVRTTLLRDLGAMRRTVEAYPDDASLWKPLGGAPNAGGTLVQHCCGNVQAYIGAALGNTGYVRDRDAEFSQREATRAQLVKKLGATMVAVERALDTYPADDASMSAAFPQKVGGHSLKVETFLVHLTAHLAYHLGQLDYHRRGVTGSSEGVKAMSIDELPEL